VIPSRHAPHARRRRPRRQLLAAPLALALFSATPALAAADGPAAAPTTGADGLRAEIRALLDEQAAAWTRGDLDAFCAGYAEDALFVSPTGLTRGRTEVLARYRSRYPDRAAMGALALELLEVRAAPGEGPPRAASAVARWTLSGPQRETATGLTLLVFHRRGTGPWQVVQDASM